MTKTTDDDIRDFCEATPTDPPSTKWSPHPEAVWCEACRSYHALPRDEKHRIALKCAAPPTEQSSAEKVLAALEELTAETGSVVKILHLAFPPEDPDAPLRLVVIVAGSWTDGVWLPIREKSLEGCLLAALADKRHVEAERA